MNRSKIPPPSASSNRGLGLRRPVSASATLTSSASNHLPPKFNIDDDTPAYENEIGTRANKRMRLDSSTPLPAAPKLTTARARQALKPPVKRILQNRNSQVAPKPALATVRPQMKMVPLINFVAAPAPKAMPTNKPAAWDFKAKFANMEGKMDVLGKENQTLKHQMTDNSNKVESLNKLISEMNQTTFVQTKEIESKSAVLLDLQRSINDKDQEIAQMRQRHARETDELLQSKNTMEVKLNNTNMEMDQLKALCESLRSNLVQASCAKDTIQAEFLAQKFLYENLQTSHSELKKTASNMTTRISELETELRDNEHERRKQHNIIQELKGNIRVFCRVRPILPEEQNNNADHLLFDPNGKALELTRTDINESTSKARTQPKLEFSFDKVFDPSSNQTEIFAELSQLVQSALDGYNVCVFAYGQTGSGKTYTMEGPAHITDFVLESDNQELGMVPLAVQQIFQTAHALAEKGWTYTIKTSIIEIYNEALRDLLNNESINKLQSATAKNAIKINTTKTGEMTVTNVRVLTVTDTKEVFKLLKQARKNRKIAATTFNDYSSRSHCVFQLKLEGRNGLTGETCNGSLNLVDLAGSERLVNESSYATDRLKETKNINKSLSNLGNVILALAQKSEHIPYRNSKLTHLLMNSLGGNSKTLMLVNVSPLEENLTETLNSLRFATQVNNCHIGTATKRIKV